MASSDKSTTRITQQFHDRGGTVYDMSSEGQHLTFRMRKRQNADEAGDWRIQISRKGAGSDDVVVGWGATRVEALKAVRRSWIDEAAASPPVAPSLVSPTLVAPPPVARPTLAWSAIEEALTAVRAI